MAVAERGTVLWAPSSDQVERATMTRYMRWLAERRGLSFEDYPSLWRWSVESLEDFWASVWEFCEVRARKPYDQVLAERRMPGARWFTGAELNYAEHIFAGARGAEPAIVSRSQTRADVEISWDELSRQVARAAAGLRALGVTPGDRVVAYMPNVPETVVAFLACASLGAIWSSCSPDFGASSVIDRFSQIEPKVLFAVDGYRYGGRDFDRLDTVAELQRHMPTLERTVVLPYLDASPATAALRDPMTWDELLGGPAPDGLRFEALPFDHPLWVLYSSGTTGLPKAIVQGHGGILVEQLKKGFLHLDCGPGDRMFWFTTTGWMMWNFLVGTLLTGATILLYDGSPDHPGPDVLWDFARDTGMTCFGTSASYIASCMKAGIAPVASHDLSALRSVGSTGSPLSPEGFRWVYDSVKPDVWLFSTSGGTDVCTAFVGGCPLLPVYLGELQCRSLGAAVAAFDERGQPVVDQVGELVITEPMPSMPLFFWNDPAPDSRGSVGERYRASYFDMFPGVWRHGDWIEITSRGTAVIYGRSDSTINRQGVRMGTSEIYRAVLAVPEVVDALVVDIPRPTGESFMPLFVVLGEGVELDDDLETEIKRRVRADCSPRHVPNRVYAIAEVPRTLSGKVLEVPVKKILTGAAPEQAASRDSLANPRSLDYFVELAGRLDRA
ncbi:MAG: acetoacetate--CoA ligase [Solirubrobacteraceae bacterium]